MNAEQAINQSVGKNEIVHLEANPASQVFVDLLCASDDSAASGGTVDFWGENWRVHVCTWPGDP